MRSKITCLVLPMILLSLLTVPLVGQNGSKPEEKSGAQISVKKEPIHSTPIQVHVMRVVVPISVVDEYDRPVPDLSADNFRIFDEKVEQTIDSFSTEEKPVAVGMIFDSSGSMSEKIQKSKDAAHEFFKNSNPEDEYQIIIFKKYGKEVRPEKVVGPTSKWEDIFNSIISLKGEGRTPLVDAIYEGVEEVKKSSMPRKALLVISDGGDNNSRYTWGDLKKQIKEADVQIYVIGVFEPLSSRNRTPEEADGPSNLAALADVTGGRMYSVEDERELPEIASKISIALRSQYIITYKPSNLIKDGRYRKVKVKLVNIPKGLPPLNVYAKPGYYAPAF